MVSILESQPAVASMVQRASQSLLQDAVGLKLPLYIASHSDFNL